jgi:hypothetical protein
MDATTAQRSARWIGALYILSIFAGLYGESIVPQKLHMANDLAGTAHRMVTSVGLFRTASPSTSSKTPATSPSTCSSTPSSAPSAAPSLCSPPASASWAQPSSPPANSSTSPPLSRPSTPMATLALWLLIKGVNRAQWAAMQTPEG